MAPIRVLLVDGHPIYRDGLHMLLERAPEIMLVGEAGDGAQALRLAADLAPEVLLLDVELPDAEGLEVVRRLLGRGSPLRVLALGIGDDLGRVLALLDAGAAGYLLKSDAAELILAAVRGAARGEAGWVSPRVVIKLAQLAKAQGVVMPALSPRQLEILRLAAAGKSNREIASAIAISEKTVEQHLADINRRLGTCSRAEAAVQAERRGLLRR